MEIKKLFVAVAVDRTKMRPPNELNLAKVHGLLLTLHVTVFCSLNLRQESLFECCESTKICLLTTLTSGALGEFRYLMVNGLRVCSFLRRHPKSSIPEWLVTPKHIRSTLFKF